MKIKLLGLIALLLVLCMSVCSCDALVGELMGGEPPVSDSGDNANGSDESDGGNENNGGNTENDHFRSGEIDQRRQIQNEYDGGNGEDGKQRFFDFFQ